MLSDEGTRDHLEKLDPEAASQDATWGEARRIIHDFNDALLDTFFDRQSRLYDLTRMYGVV